MQQGTGNDNLAVRWQLPNGTNEEPMQAVSPAGTWLIPFTSGIQTPPGIYQQPTNLTVSDGLDAAFFVLVTNAASVTYQWLRNGANLTDAKRHQPGLPVSHSNPTNRQQSEFHMHRIQFSRQHDQRLPRMLTVIPDITPPTVVQTLYQNPTNVLISFSEPLELSSATNLSHYVFTNGLPVVAASLGFDNQSVNLTTAPLVSGSNFVIVLNGIRDRATTPNMIASTPWSPFFAGPYTPQGIGSPSPSGTIAVAGSGYDMGGGRQKHRGNQRSVPICLAAGHGRLRHRSLRLNSFAQTDAFAEAGLMAREDLTPGARFAAVLATPSMNGAYFESRATAGGSSSTSGNLRVNYPYLWLRLQAARQPVHRFRQLRWCGVAATWDGLASLLYQLEFISAWPFAAIALTQSRHGQLP